MFVVSSCYLGIKVIGLVLGDCVGSFVGLILGK